MAAIPADQVERLSRIARADGLEVRKAETKAQAQAWGGRLSVVAGDSFRFATSSPDALRAWLHVHGRHG